ncbi:MAG: isopenicillin N synthase family oxygenase [Alphaproteobacteria bacterium]|nr:isopenicillin N synthase family oxygenase [Alphaproteobacteria bacterium]
MPVIDLAALGSGDAAAERRTAAALGQACRETGFFYATGHGIAPARIAATFAAARDFFDRPLDDKLAVAITRSRHNRGYVPLAAEALDPARPGDAKECFNIGRELAPDDPGLRAGRPFHGPNQWPAAPTGFRAIMLEYFAAMQRVCERLHRGFALDLGLAADHFAPFIDRPLATLRLLRYPPHPGAFDGSLWGAAPHTDYGNVTILAQGDESGLQVRRRDGTWIDAPVIADAFVCNIGDCLMRWSNDVYVSTPHRVVNRAGRLRHSMAFFFDPNDDAPVECLPTCRSDERPPRYAPTTGAAYLKERLDATYAFRREG